MRADCHHVERLIWRARLPRILAGWAAARSRSTQFGAKGTTFRRLSNGLRGHGGAVRIDGSVLIPALTVRVRASHLIGNLRPLQCRT
jgi:hypothetical protein